MTKKKRKIIISIVMIVVGVFLLALNIINEKYMNTKELPARYKPCG